MYQEVSFFLAVNTSELLACSQTFCRSGGRTCSSSLRLKRGGQAAVDQSDFVFQVNNVALELANTAILSAMFEDLCRLLQLGYPGNSNVWEASALRQLGEIEAEIVRLGKKEDNAEVLMCCWEIESVQECQGLPAGPFLMFWDIELTDWGTHRY